MEQVNVSSMSDEQLMSRRDEIYKKMGVVSSIVGDTSHIMETLFDFLDEIIVELEIRNGRKELEEWKSQPSVINVDEEQVAEVQTKTKKAGSPRARRQGGRSSYRRSTAPSSDPI